MLSFFFLFFRARNKHQTVSETIALIIEKRGSLTQCNNKPEFAKSSVLRNVEALNRQSLGDFTKMEGTQMEMFNFLWLILGHYLPLTPTKNN